MKIAILTSPKQWFIPYAKELQKLINADLFYDHKEIFNYEIVFILSYHKIIDKKFLQQNKHNIVIHASNLPQGKGWSPLFHQVIEGRDEIVFSVFEADEKADNGDIYLQKTLILNGLELYEELREKQARFCLELCVDFLKLYPNIKAQKQKGKESFYPKRSAKDSELDINKSINEQFNLLRTTSNEEFPAFFYKDGKKFILKIYTQNSFDTSVQTTGGGVKIILENFIHLNKYKKEQIRRLRNLPQIKKYLYHQHFISKNEHKKFIKRLRTTNQKIYFCLSVKNQILGSINFHFKDASSIEFGFYSNPYSKVSGMGRILEQISIYYAFYILQAKTLYLEAFRENLQVINLHKKFGFVEFYSKNEKIIKMQLKKHLISTKVKN
ncbi:UDP-4-amino-4,6-dideoxy-N-acetyl-beta-L-altrosamine N-acetyltransferase [Campylobacter sp. CCS1377]|uniref:UDP-4-amino-4, 6-dideoxy-N-acetyl-beta-L-altrosamine N-acetyltransferase n=1 Tax=Campylobacter sp. CCS1377 TaxID=3158229 RepID=A0AAU7E893_9BACT